jgi:hypothetical protein
MPSSQVLDTKGEYFKNELHYYGAILSSLLQISFEKNQIVGR